MATQKEISFGIKVREDSILKQPIYINQFRVLNEDGLVHLFVNFNFARQNLYSGLMLINESTINLNKDSISPYYEKLVNSSPQGSPAEETSFTGGTPQLFHGNFLEFSHYGPLAQVRLIYFSVWHLAVVNKNQTGDVPAETACVLNLPLEVQLGMIRKLFFGSSK